MINKEEMEKKIAEERRAGIDKLLRSIRLALMLQARDAADHDRIGGD